MKKIMFLLFLLLGLGNAHASGTITSGGATFNWITTASFDLGIYTMTTEPGADPLGFQHWFAYRTQSDTREFFFPEADMEDYTGNVATLTWNNVDGKGFGATVTLVLSDIPGNALLASSTLVITNNSGANLGIELFTLMDFDKPASGFGDDMAILRAPDIIQVTDTGAPDGPVCDFAGFGSTAHKTTATIIAGNLRDLLRDGNIDNWDNTGLPFGPGDWVGSFQYSFPSVTDGDRVAARTDFSVNVDVVPPWDRDVPTLSTWSILLLGLLLLALGLVAFRRRMVPA